MGNRCHLCSIKNALLPGKLNFKMSSQHLYKLSPEKSLLPHFDTNNEEGQHLPSVLSWETLFIIRFLRCRAVS